MRFAFPPYGAAALPEELFRAELGPNFVPKLEIGNEKNDLKK
jgi:hypothetical protein